MFGIKKKTETFVFEPAMSTVMIGNDVKGKVLHTLLRRYHANGSFPCKGKRVFNKHTYDWNVELDEFKGVLLNGCYFVDSSGHFVTETTDNSHFI